MKKVLLLFLIVFNSLAFAQNTPKENIKYVKITQKKCLKKSGCQIVFKELVSDSRCPEGVTCVWAGEASAIVSLYKDSKLVEEKTIVFSMKNIEENKQWFSKYLPVKQRKIKTVGVFPYPKQGVVGNKKDYYIKIGYVK
ncbi:hypothetical protein ACFX5D_03250 [Flavobacterium sp. LB3P45]|uniref:Uncharacterized protein n=1 Tax=Flavobacterium fructosi TaxID=3230416 RepID=A0ABW6HJW4_9FLAO